MSLGEHVVSTEAIFQSLTIVYLFTFPSLNFYPHPASSFQHNAKYINNGENLLSNEDVDISVLYYNMGSIYITTLSYDNDSQRLVTVRWHTNTHGDLTVTHRHSMK